MNHFLKEQFDLIVSDLSALGGLFFYGLVFLMFFLLKEVQMAIKLLIGVILVYIIVSLLRLFFFKERPMKKAHHNIIEKIDAGSFPSMHATRATFLFITLSNFFQNKLVTGFFILLVFLIAYSRWYLKKHYMRDLIIGAILGLIVIFFIETFIKF